MRTFILPFQNDLAIDYIQSVDKRMLCKIGKEKHTRSVVQNRYYWFLMTILQNENGDDKEIWHDRFGEWWRRRTGELKGETFEYTISTTRLSTVEFENYLSKIRTWASAELGCYLPLPNETQFDYLKL